MGGERTDGQSDDIKRRALCKQAIAVENRTSACGGVSWQIVIDRPITESTIGEIEERLLGCRFVTLSREHDEMESLGINISICSEGGGGA